MRDKANKFPEMGDMSAIRTARIWHCGYRSLMPISGMINVEELVIGTWPDSSLEVLSRMSQLRYLRIVHMPKVVDLAALEHLRNLEVLSLGTLPSWDASRKFTIVDSLAPISRLSKLRQLELFGICAADNSLRDLLHCPQLQSARFSQYPKDEVENFYKVTGLSEAYAVEPSFQ